MKVSVEVYGCTANKADANLIKGILKDNQYKIVKQTENADYIVILTCTVIDTTEQRMLSRIKKIKTLGKPVVVAGCMASVRKEKIKQILPDAILLPPQYSHHIIDILKSKDIVLKEKDKTYFPKYYDEIIAPVLIAEGCMFSCSYCITTLARGKLRSFPVDEITNDVTNAIKYGCKEIQLTSQDTSSFGLDIKTNLGELLKKVVKLDLDFRIRIGMMNPFTCLKNLESIIEGFKDFKIYRFIHLPIQSGDNEILKKMNRKYNVEEVELIIEKFRENYPNITLSTDVIVGFPGETEYNFQKTVELLKKIKPDITNITRFSARPGTKAKNMIGRVKTEVVKQRSKILTDICSDISYQQNKKHVGKEYKVLITEKGKSNTFIGRSRNYKPVVIREKIKLGTFKNIEIIEAKPTFLFGSII
jgi:MiaB-like tRNA modifying enzyme